VFFPDVYDNERWDTVFYSVTPDNNQVKGSNVDKNKQTPRSFPFMQDKMKTHPRNIMSFTPSTTDVTNSNALI